jgi:hypothetical protein
MKINNVLIAGLLSAGLLGCGGSSQSLDTTSGSESVQRMTLGGAPRVFQADGESITAVSIAGYRDNYHVVKNQTTNVVTVTSKIDNSVSTYQNPSLIKFVDKWVSFDIDGSPGQVYRLYQAAFNRKPDLPGLGFWIAANQNGRDLLGIASDFVVSAEFKTLYGDSPVNLKLINAFYNNVLHRDGEKAGVDWWVGQMNNGAPAYGVLYGFSDSAENKNNLQAAMLNGFDYVPFNQGGAIVPKASSYENKVAAAAVLGPQPLPAIAGDATAFGDFFHDGTYAMVTNTLIYDSTNPATANQFGSIHFFQKVKDSWMDNTAALLKDTKGCLHPRKAVVADFNGDGKPDVFFACHGFDAPPYAGEQPHVLMSQSDGSYSNVTLAITCFCHSASSADFNGNGYADIVVTDTGVLKQPFFLRNKIGSFSVDVKSLPASLNGQALYSTELIDFNGDGKYDLWIGGDEPGASQYAGGMPSEIILNDTGNGFLTSRIYALPIIPDYGLPLDIVYQDGKVYLLRTNIGGGPTNYGKSYYTTSAVQVIDFASMHSSIAYSHGGAYANGMQWINWIIPYNGQVVALNSSYPVSVK